MRRPQTLDKRHAIIVDVETESTGDLTKLGAYAYSKHPSTDIQCISWRGADEPIGSERLWFPTFCGDNQIPYELKIWISTKGANAIVYAFNAFFEECIWENIMVERYGWPSVPLNNWSCLSALAGYYGYPQNLDRCTAAMKLDVVKDKDGHALMMSMTNPNRRSKKVLANWDENLIRLGKYCQQDVAAEGAILHALPPLPESERQIWLMDQAINWRGLPFDMPLVDAAVSLTDQIRQDACARLPGMTDGAVSTPNQVQKILSWLQFYTPFQVDNLTAQTVTELLENEEVIEEVKDVLRVRQRAGTAAIKKFKRAQMQCVDGRARGLFWYYGAHTGRWAGRGTQPSNMPRLNFVGEGATPEQREADRKKKVQAGVDAILSGSLEPLRVLDPGNPTNVMTKCVRPSVCAPPGNVFVASDFAGIELRVLLWLVGDTESLKRIIEHGSSQLYIDMAETIYSRPINKKKDWHEYTCGKAATLGCGYQASGRGLVEAAYNMYGIRISRELGDLIVSTYRKKYLKVSSSWRSVDSRVKDVCTDGFPRRYRDLVQFRFERGALAITLPSGRDLWYPNARIEECSKGFKNVAFDSEKNKKPIRARLYGGLEVENIVQAISRDLLTDSMLKLEAQNFPTVSHCYDEVVSEVEASRADECLAAHHAIMTKPPSWAKGLPLAIDSWAGRRYRK